MHYWNKAIIYIALLVSGSSASVRGQSRPVRSDTAQMRLALNKGNAFSSVNNDSAEVYADKVLEKSTAAKNQYFLAQALFLKAKVCYFKAEFKKAQEYQAKAIEQARRNGDNLLLSKAYNLAGAIYYSLGNYEEALGQYNNRLNIVRQLQDTSSTLQALYNISLVYTARGEHRNTIEILLKAMNLALITKDTVNLMGLNEGLGMAWSQLDEPGKGLLYLNKAYQFSILRKDLYEQGGILIDIGNIYQQRNDHYRAINYYDEAILITRKDEDKRRTAVAISNKATSLMHLGNYRTALELSDEAIAITTGINYIKGLSDALANKAECLLLLKQYKEAEPFAIKAMEIAARIRTRKEEYRTYLLLSTIYDKLNDRKKAYDYYKKHIRLRDSLNNKDEIRIISGIEFGFEKEKLNQQRQFEEASAAAEVKKQKSIRNIVMGAGIIMLALFFFILKNYSAKRRANNEITRQHKIIEQQNDSILQSIAYARRIQQAILTPPETIRRLLPESFVLYRPKDIVSGDFYFIEPVYPLSNSETWVAVALADCTGHGVPGALMSLTGYNILKQSLIEPGVKDPGSALDFLNRELYNFLKQNQREQQIRDGMDIAFCAFNFEKNKMMFSAANNPLWLLSRREELKDQNGATHSKLASVGGYTLFELKANKQPIGYSEKTEKFTTYDINLQSGDLVYLFTDGYADQFGGPRQKKFKYKQLQELILQHADKSMPAQKQALENAIDLWKGELEQVDDISLIGIRV
ncbi:MAG: tetratricopeptide repeat protein [Bacteroidia bacterium]